MDAIKFIKERNRMCKSFGGSCDGCPADKNTCCDAFEWQEELITIVEEWSKEHPHKTRQDVFLEQFPNVELDGNGIINISPCKVDPKQYPFNGKNCRKFQRCGECLQEFWMQEVE